MKLFSSDKIREIDAYTIKNEPIESIDLMERAAMALFKAIISIYPKTTQFVIFVGPGNNGGDGLALARMLHRESYKVHTYVVADIASLSEDGRINYERLHIIDSKHLHLIKEGMDFPQIEDETVVVDALFGSGLSRPLKGRYKALVQHINTGNSDVVSIDVPSGLFCDNNEDNTRDSIVKATYTLSLQFAKLAFLLAENQDYVGHWRIIDIKLHPHIIEKLESEYQLLDKKTLGDIYKVRKRFAHKGSFGHALLLAGSYGKMGAAVLAARASLKSGLGLLTVHIPRMGYQIMQTAVPEAMVCIDRSEILITECPDLSVFKAVGIGPGIGTKQNTELLVHELLEMNNLPMVIDADGLNILAKHPEWLSLLKKDTILTPHPGEFARLAGPFKDDFDQLEKARRFAQHYDIVLVLKGAHTLIVDGTGRCVFNDTGNNGMATAGSGDVLTGIITGLLAQGYRAKDAAILGVWSHGLAGDLYVKKNGFEALTSSELIHYLGKSFFEISHY